MTPTCLQEGRSTLHRGFHSLLLPARHLLSFGSQKTSNRRARDELGLGRRLPLLLLPVDGGLKVCSWGLAKLRVNQAARSCEGLCLYSSGLLGNGQESYLESTEHVPGRWTIAAADCGALGLTSALA